MTRRRRTGPETAGRTRIVFRRVPVYHRVAFAQLVSFAALGQRCLRHRGAYWAPITVERGVGLYHSAPDMLACIEEMVDRYEHLFYGMLLRGCCGRDGVLRSRTHLLRHNGALRASASGGAYEE